jgi:hypothetical protein
MIILYEEREFTEDFIEKYYNIINFSIIGFFKELSLDYINKNKKEWFSIKPICCRKRF